MFLREVIEPILFFYLVIFALLYVISLKKRKELSQIKNEIICNIRKINELYIIHRKEINIHTQNEIIGKIFDLYKENLLLINNTKSEEIVKNMIEDELNYCYKKFYKQYISEYGDEERYVIINHYISKWNKIKK